MSNQKQEENQKEKKEAGNGSGNFIQETIKAKPVNKKRFFIRLILTVVIAASAACVAAFVFVFMVPVAEHVTGREAVHERITVQSDSQEPTPTPTVTPTPTPAASDSSKEPSGGENPEDNDGDDGSGTVDSGSGKEQEPEEPDLTIEDYIELNQQITEMSDNARRSVVSVTGITNVLDYFENTYENSQQMTGLIIADSGDDLYILTSYHVVENVERIQVTFANGYIADAYFQRADPGTGLAVIKVGTADIPKETREAFATASLAGSGLIAPGDRILAIGNLMGYNHSVTFGTVVSVSNTYSAPDREYRLISTDIGTGANNSGVLINLRGSVVGFIVTPDRNGLDASIQAFDITGIKALIEDLSNNQSRSYLGIHGLTVTDRTSERAGIPKGVLITSLEEDSPALQSGIMEYDILVNVNGTDISSMAAYEETLSAVEAGAPVHVVTMRKGTEGYTEIEFDMTAGEI